MKSLFDAARVCLDAASADTKPALTLELADAFRRGARSVDDHRNR